MAALPVVPALVGLGTAIVGGGVALIKPTVDLIEDAVLKPTVNLIRGAGEIIGDVTDKTGEQKRHHFFHYPKQCGRILISLL